MTSNARVRLTVEPVPELGNRPCYVIRRGGLEIIGGPFDTPAAHIHRAQAERLARSLGWAGYAEPLDPLDPRMATRNRRAQAATARIDAAARAAGLR